MKSCQDLMMLRHSCQCDGRRQFFGPHLCWGLRRGATSTALYVRRLNQTSFLGHMMPTTLYSQNLCVCSGVLVWFGGFSDGCVTFLAKPNRVCHRKCGGFSSTGRSLTIPPFRGRIGGQCTYHSGALSAPPVCCGTTPAIQCQYWCSGQEYASSIL